MKKINILLVCNAGMSTSLIVDSMKKAAKEKGIDSDIDAQAADQVKVHYAGKDIILLGPQVRFKQKQIQKEVGDIPVVVMDMAAYGQMNGEKILNDVMKEID